MESIFLATGSKCYPVLSTIRTMVFASLQNKQKSPGLHFLLKVLTNAESAHTEQSFAKPVKNIYCTVQREKI